MKKYKKILLYIIFWIISKTSFARDWWILAEDWSKLRDWTVWFKDIPEIISHATWFFIWFAAVIAVLFIIIWAYKILFWSITQDTTKGRDTIISAIWGFILAALAWFIVKIILDNFG